MKRIVKTILLFVAVLCIVSGALLAWLSRGLSDIRKETVSPIVFADLEDGVYEGSYDKYRWSSTVRVMITDGRVVDIELLEDHRIPADVTIAILIMRIKEATTLDVDVVAGATVSSIAYLKAVEDALSE